MSEENWLKKFREQAGHTQQELADTCEGISLHQIKGWEDNGKNYQKTPRSSGGGK